MQKSILKAVAESVIVSTLLLVLSPVIAIILLFTAIPIIFFIFENIFGKSYTQTLPLISKFLTIPFFLLIFSPGLIINWRITKTGSAFTRFISIIIFLTIQAMITFLIYKKLFSKPISMDF